MSLVVLVGSTVIALSESRRFGPGLRSTIQLGESNVLVVSRRGCWRLNESSFGGRRDISTTMTLVEVGSNPAVPLSVTMLPNANEE